MKKILIAVDFSSHTEFSCNYALDMAITNNAEIMLFHTFFTQYYFSSPSMPDAFEISPFSNSETSSEAEESAKTQLNNLQNELIERAKQICNKPIKIKTKITNGNFDDDLIEFCSDYFPSVVIIGSKGIGESTSLFGRTAIRIFNKLKHPVIVIPATDDSKSIDNVMYIADLEASNNVLIRKTFNLLENFNPKIFCVHLAEDNNYLKAYSSNEYLKSEYQKELNENKFQSEVLEGTDKHEEIDEYIKKNDISLIVFMPHKTNFFQRLIGQEKSKEYLFETNLPLLAIRL